MLRSASVLACNFVVTSRIRVMSPQSLAIALPVAPVRPHDPTGGYFAFTTFDGVLQFVSDRLCSMTRQTFGGASS